MTITNNLGLPKAFVSAVSREKHNSKGCYSATTLNKGAREIILTDRHWDKLSQDVSDMVWAVWGTAVHALFEAEKDNCFHEEAFKVQVSNSFVTGKVDSYDMESGVITDWKTASIWKVQYKDFEDWKQQGLTYAWLLRKTGLEVNKCRFVALLKDHSKSKASFDNNYPQSPVFVYEFDVTDELLAETEKRLTAKIVELELNFDVKDDELPMCSDSERWAKPNKWAVMKKGRKTALKVFDSAELAKDYLKTNGDSIEFRKGEDGKCANYCQCRDFCNYYKEKVSHETGDKTNDRY